MKLIPGGHGEREGGPMLIALLVPCWRGVALCWVATSMMCTVTKSGIWECRWDFCPPFWSSKTLCKSLHILKTFCTHKEVFNTNIYILARKEWMSPAKWGNTARTFLPRSHHTSLWCQMCAFPPHCNILLYQPVASESIQFGHYLEFTWDLPLQTPTTSHMLSPVLLTV